MDSVPSRDFINNAFVEVMESDYNLNQLNPCFFMNTDHLVRAHKSYFWYDDQWAIRVIHDPHELREQKRNLDWHTGRGLVMPKIEYGVIEYHNCQHPGLRTEFVTGMQIDPQRLENFQPDVLAREYQRCLSAFIDGSLKRSPTIADPDWSEYIYGVTPSNPTPQLYFVDADIYSFERYNLESYARLVAYAQVFPKNTHIRELEHYFVEIVLDRQYRLIDEYNLFDILEN